MKKLISMLAIFAILMVGAMSVVKAVTTETLPDELYAIGSQYGMKESDKLRIEKYLSEYPLSDTECNDILSSAQEASQIMKDNNTTDYHSLPADVKAELRALANDAASIAGVTLDFKSDSIDVYKDGKLIDSVTSKGTLPYTGNNNIVLVVSSIAVIALVAVVARKKLANA